jgi:hypothetical protein
MRQLARPTDEDLSKSERLADRIGRVPILGVPWRWAQRATHDQVHADLDEYRRWRDSGDRES